MAGAAGRVLLKTTTGLTGMTVSEFPHRELTVIYGRIVRTLEKMPATAAYRKYTEPIIQERLKLVEGEPDINILEKKINMGHIEEVIIQAKNELSVARTFVKYKPWEPLVEQPAAEQWRWPV